MYIPFTLKIKDMCLKTEHNVVNETNCNLYYDKYLKSSYVLKEESRRLFSLNIMKVIDIFCATDE